MPRQAKSSKHTIIMNMCQQLKPQLALKNFRGKMRERAEMIQVAEEAMVMIHNAIKAECAAARKKNQVFDKTCSQNVQHLCDIWSRDNKEALTKAEQNMKKAQATIENETANIMIAGVLQEKIKNISNMVKF